MKTISELTDGEHGVGENRPSDVVLIDSEIVAAEILFDIEVGIRAIDLDFFKARTIAQGVEFSLLSIVEVLFVEDAAKLIGRIAHSAVEVFFDPLKQGVVEVFDLFFLGDGCIGGVTGVVG